MNKRHYEHTLPNIRGSLSNTYTSTMQVMKKQVLWKIHCQFRKEVPYNNRKTSKVITAIGGTGHDDNFPACTG